jgi:hypothetical protein
MAEVKVHLCDSATKLEAQHRDAVVVCGSHGGVYPAYLAAKAGLRAVILCDAGEGMDRAGIGCLYYCQALGMAAATVDTSTARIADAEDLHRRGRISHANAIAAAAGAEEGQSVAEAAERLRAARAWSSEPPPYREARSVIRDEPGRPRVIVMDSVSLVRPEDAGQIVLTGSHGALLAGRPDSAITAPVLAAAFNDAGVGIDNAGISRLPALDAQGIAGVTVAAMSARIGDGRSTYEDGVLSHVNAAAAARGAKPGMSARAFVDLLLA